MDQKLTREAWNSKDPKLNKLIHPPIQQTFAERRKKKGCPNRVGTLSSPSPCKVHGLVDRPKDTDSKAHDMF